jgi:hypothetical protein
MYTVIELGEPLKLVAGENRNLVAADNAKPRVGETVATSNQ